MGEKARDDATRRYVAANKQIGNATHRDDELKAHGLAPRHKRALYNALRNCTSVSAEVDVNRLAENVLRGKESICRYKDFVLKLAVKKVMVDFISIGRVDPNRPITIHLNVDEQLTATDGAYKLDGTILKEFRYGMDNWKYQKSFPPIVHNALRVILKYRESKHDYLIQASDILANRIWTSYVVGKPEMRIIPNHSNLTFP